MKLIILLSILCAFGKGDAFVHPGLLPPVPAPRGQVLDNKRESSFSTSTRLRRMGAEEEGGREALNQVGDFFPLRPPSLQQEDDVVREETASPFGHGGPPASVYVLAFLVGLAVVGVNEGSLATLFGTEDLFLGLDFDGHVLDQVVYTLTHLPQIVAPLMGK